MASYMPGKMEGLFVHRASSRDIGQVWIPKLCDSITCNSGMEHYQVGQWLLIDMVTNQVVQALPSGPYEAQPHQTENFPDYVFAKVKVPIVFYSEPSENNKIVAYSPQFGRIAYIFEQKDRIVDKLRYAWISYMALFRGNAGLRNLLKGFNAGWMVSNNLGDVLTTEQIREENKKCQQKFCTGIVVHCEEQRLEQPAVTYVAFHIWTANLEGGKPGVAIHRILKEKLEADEQMKKLRTIGTFCKLMIFKNWSNKFTAVSPFPNERSPTGYHVERIQPKLELKISNDQYHLDQDPAALRVHIRDMIGPITCSRDFIQRFRRVRQGQPGFQPRLFIDYDLDSNEWKPTRFDGINRSPSPGPSTSQSNQAIQPHPERGSAFTKYRSPKAIPIDSEESLNDSPPSSSDQSLPKQFNGNGRARQDSSPPPSISSEFGDSDDEDEEIAALAEEVKAGTDLDNTTTESTSTNPQNGRPRPMPLNSLPNGSAATRRRPVASQFHNNSPPPHQQFLDRCSRSARVQPSHQRGPPVKGKKNISGVLVSKTSDGFYVYTPPYPKELFLPNSKVENIPGCGHGSWIFFDTKEDGDRVEIINPRLDATMPYETIVVRNTVQLKLDGMVPKLWNPQMSTFVPVINTNYVEKVIDSKHLLGKDFAGATLPVVVERKKDKETGYTWFIASLGEGY